MRYIWHHISTILSAYDGSLPLAHFLKGYFKQHPKLGSRDRKWLSTMIYSWYRCSKGVMPAAMSMEEKVAACLQLCQVDIGMSLPALGESAYSINIDALFPYPVALSTGIGRNEWLNSMLTQPDLFIRIRKNRKQAEAMLTRAQLQYRLIGESCIALPNGAKIEAVLPADLYVVQDASSQATANYFHPKKGERWWDCCCGAGGKSLLIKDAQPDVKLTVSDRRDTIIHNLKQRFKLYGHTLPTAIVTDIADPVAVKSALGSQQFDNIISDVPCSGSGTWARTPEQLYFFDPSRVEQYSALQHAIATNAAAHLKPGGRLNYITCSVFAQENEIVVEAVTKKTGLQVENMQLINGVSNRADSMFIAVLRKHDA